VEFVEKSVFVKASPDECFRVATGYEDYPVWAKATAGVSVLDRTVYIDTCFQSTHCNSLQHTATHCNTLQYIATHCNTQASGWCQRARPHGDNISMMALVYTGTPTM